MQKPQRTPVAPSAAVRTLTPLNRKSRSSADTLMLPWPATLGKPRRMTSCLENLLGRYVQVPRPSHVEAAYGKEKEVKEIRDSFLKVPGEKAAALNTWSDAPVTKTRLSHLLPT